MKTSERLRNGLGALILVAALAALASAQEDSPTLQELQEKLQTNIQSLDVATLEETRQLIADVEKRTSALPARESWLPRLRMAQARMAVSALDPGELHTARGELKSLVEDVTAGDPVRLQALHSLFRDEIQQKTPSLETTAQLLSELELARQREPTLFQLLQFEAVRSLYEGAVTNAQSQQSPEKIAERLEMELQRLADQLQEQGVLPSVTQLLQFGQVAIAEGQRDDARLESALSSLQPVIDSAEVADIWRMLYFNKWAEQHIRRRRYTEAFQALSRMSGLALRLNELAIYAVAQTQLGHLSLRMGDYAEAKRILEAADLQNIYSQITDMDKVCTWKVNRAKALEGESALFPARTLLEEAAKAAESAQNSTELQTLVRNNLGVNYYLAGELETATALLTDNLQQKELASVNPISLAESRINLGWIALASSNPAAAQRHFQTAADMVQQAANEQHPRFAEALSCAARASAQLGNHAKAQAQIRQAEQLSFAQTLSYLATSWSAQDRLAIVQEARVHPESIAWPGVFDTFLELAPQIGIRPDEQYQVVTRWKGMLETFESRDRSAIPKETREAEARLSAQLRDAYFRKVPLAQRGRLQAEIRSLEEELRNIRRILRPTTTSSETLATPAASTPGATSPQRPTRLPLRAGQAVLDIVQFRKYRHPTPTAFGADKEFLGYVTLPDGKCHRVSLGGGDELEALIGQWRDAITSESPEERELADKVAMRVQRPLLELIPRVERLIIRSDGATYLLPWCALPGVQQKKFWIENVLIETVRTFHQPQELQKKKSPNERPTILLVGNVDYGKSGAQLGALPNSLREIQTVRSIFAKANPNADVVQLEQDQASEEELIKQMPARQFIHLATHGYFLRRESSDAFSISGVTTLLNSGIIVAPPQKSDGLYDEYLSAAEIAPLDLSAAELVMLSACETGLGKFRAGQGIEGLVTSFQNAGARRVISSLWKVEDYSAALVSENFYRHLWTGHATNYAAALRSAQLDLLRSDDVHLQTPVAWAGFVISSIAPE